MLSPSVLTGLPVHGGDLAAAQRLRPEIAATDWIDLSTGINPVGYPVSALPIEVWQDLPASALLDGCLDAARSYYGVPNFGGLLAVAGSQMAIQMLPQLFDKPDVAVVGPTYAEHAHVWRAAGSQIIDIEHAEMVQTSADLLVVVNPNNPTGELISAQQLTGIVRQRTAQDRWTIVDEAFMDLTPDQSVCELTRSENLIVLKSLGKFFGLAGARVGFLLAPEEILAPAYQHLGPWPIAGPSAFVAGAALADRDWQVETRRRLTADRDRLALAVQDGLGIPVGGTDLFLHLQHHRAPQFFDALLDRAIYVRRFEHDLTRLRIGLPQPGPAFERTTAALDVLSKI